MLLKVLDPNTLKKEVVILAVLLAQVFFPTKSLGCYGDGGALFTNNKNIADRCKVIRSHGQKKKNTIIKSWV